MKAIDFSSLLEQMGKPSFYPHPVREPIELVQTHASAVFLTGDYAYKVKKPVDFGFLDYSTLAKRQHFLNRELSLNQPIAPDIYIEVLPITLSGDLLELNGQGPPIEHVLKMHQFPQESLFINLFSRGELKAFHVESLGEAVAKFHAQTQTDNYIKSFGEVEKIKQSIDENYQQTEQYIGIAQTQEQYDETRAFTDSFLSENSPLFKQRQRADKIRECHGDLHLKNICWWHDKIQLFDRIEFNEAFRFVDVMYDVAFTVMDLDARGRKDFSNLFSNTYLEQTGDWEGLPVLPLYLSRQAYVRAKVNSLLLDDPAVPEAEKQQAVRSAADYYHLAWEYTQKPKASLWMMSGLSGSGKTTVARALAQRIGAVHIRSDAVRKHLAGMSLEQRGSGDLYGPEMTQKTYARLLDLSVMAAQAGFPAILDAKYDRRNLREEVLAAAQRHQLPLTLVYCTAPLEVLRQRLDQRSGDISDATPALLDSQQAKAEPFTDRERGFLLTLDTSRSDWLSQLESYLGREATLADRS